MSDLINRQDAIDKLKTHRALFCRNRIEFQMLSENEKCRVDEIDTCISELLNLPSAERKGKWIIESSTTDYPYKCSACKKYSRAMYDFCPNCGVYTKEERYGKLLEC